MHAFWSQKTAATQNAGKTYSVSWHRFIETPKDGQMWMLRMNAYSWHVIRNNKHTERWQRDGVAAADTKWHGLAW